MMEYVNWNTFYERLDRKVIKHQAYSQLTLLLGPSSSLPPPLSLPLTDINFLPPPLDPDELEFEANTCLNLSLEPPPGRAIGEAEELPSDFSILTLGLVEVVGRIDQRSISIF